MPPGTPATLPPIGTVFGTRQVIGYAEPDDKGTKRVIIGCSCGRRVTLTLAAVAKTKRCRHCYKATRAWSRLSPTRP